VRLLEPGTIVTPTPAGCYIYLGNAECWRAELAYFRGGTGVQRQEDAR